jgi:hypothetical protein
MGFRILSWRMLRKYFDSLRREQKLLGKLIERLVLRNSFETYILVFSFDNSLVGRRFPKNVSPFNGSPAR